MSDTTTHGRYVWFELLTTDPKAAIDFYTDVVGWKTEAWESADYSIWLGSQGPVGGVTLLTEEAKKNGAPSFWQGCLEVADVDRTVALAKERGGGVLVEPVDVPNVGRIAVISDPQGAVVSVMAPATPMDAHDISKAGEFSWHELFSSDHEAGFRFYSELFGWQKLDEIDMGAMGKYLLWGRDGKQLGGMMTMTGMKTPDGRPVPPSWMYYVATADLDAALERAKQRGARVINGPMEVPGGQRIVQLLDPQGAAFSLVTTPKT